MADKVVAKRDGRAKFSVRPDKVTARKEARARRRGQADMSALYGAEKGTHEMQSRVGRVRRENKEKLREKLAKGDSV